MGYLRSKEKQRCRKALMAAARLRLPKIFLPSTQTSKWYWPLNTHPINKITYYSQSQILSWPRLKLNSKIGLHTTTTTTTQHHHLHHHHLHHPPTTQTLRQQYLSCYWPDLDQTLNKGSLEHIQQITTVTTTFV